MTKHVPHFEVLRGLAAIWVLISHVLLIMDLPIPYLSSGGMAVDVFIILSGFVIALMLINRDESYGRYIFRRWARLYPLFIIALVYGAFTDHLYAPVFGDSPWLETARTGFQTREINLESAWWEHLFLHLTMLHGAVPDTLLPQVSLMFSGPLWSISLEWQFYLVAPFLIAAISFRSIRSSAVAFAVLAAAIAFEYVTRKVWVGEVPSFLLVKLPLFIVGIMSAAFWSRARDMAPAILSVMVAVAFLASVQFSSHKLPLLIWFCVYLSAAVHRKIAVSRLVDNIVSSRVPRFVGEVSYGLYVLHLPTMLLLSYFVVIPFMGSADKLTAGLAIGGLTLAVTLVLAHATYRHIELPVIEWAKGVSGRRSRPGAAAA